MTAVGSLWLRSLSCSAGARRSAQRNRRNLRRARLPAVRRQRACSASAPRSPRTKPLWTSWWSARARRPCRARTEPAAPIRRGWRRRSSSGCPALRLTVTRRIKPAPDRRGNGRRNADKSIARRKAEFGDMADRNRRRHARDRPGGFPHQRSTTASRHCRPRDADVILMNMQYSPRTESMIAVGAYADNMRWVAREREVSAVRPARASCAIGARPAAFDLYAATKDLCTGEARA